MFVSPAQVLLARMFLPPRVILKPHGMANERSTLLLGDEVGALLGVSPRP